MNRGLKYIIIFLVTIVLLSAVLYLVPWRTPISIHMYGAVVTADGEILSTTRVGVSGGILEYLFQSDRLELDITMDELHWIDLKTGGVYSGDGRWPFIFADWKGHYRELSGFDSGYLGLTFEKDMLILSSFGADDRYLVASIDSDFAPQEVLETFSKLVD